MSVREIVVNSTAGENGYMYSIGMYGIFEYSGCHEIFPIGKYIRLKNISMSDAQNRVWLIGCIKPFEFDGFSFFTTGCRRGLSGVKIVLFASDRGISRKCQSDGVHF